MAHNGKDEGISSGATRLLKTKAGNAEAIPAINHDSASLLRVGKPMKGVDVPHHARTGREKPASHRGIARRTKSAFPANSVEF